MLYFKKRKAPEIAHDWVYLLDSVSGWIVSVFYRYDDGAEHDNLTTETQMHVSVVIPAF